MFYAVTFFVIITLLLLYLDTRKPRNYPFGPHWYPIVGNAIQIAKLRVKYGMFCMVVGELNNIFNCNGVVGLKLGKDKLVVANSSEAIKEMMSNEDLDGRPTGVFFETRTWGTRRGVLLTDEGFWQEQRRFIVRHLKEFGFARRGMVSLIQNEAEFFLQDLNKIIQKHGGQKAIIPMNNLFGVYILNTLWLLLAGIRYDRDNDEIKYIQKIFNEFFKNVDMVGCLFGHFPFLRYIAPNYSGYSQFVDIHKKVYAFLNVEIENHKRNFNPGNEPQDLIDSYLQMIYTDGHNPGFSDKQLLAVCLDLFIAGSETTTKSLGFACVHMVRDYSIQEKIRAELDAVIGRERLPQWEDRINLPYCDAVVHEAVRMFMGSTFGIPHRALRSTRLCGHCIPKDTMVIACFRGMCMDKKIFPEPEKFLPERFLKNNELVVPDCFAPFGVGKRRCMGEQMGRQNLFLFITTLIQNFKLLVPEGHPLPDPDPIDGVTPSIKPYEAVLVPR